MRCRIIALEGKASTDVAGDAGGLALQIQQELPDAWVALGDGTRLVAKDPRTTRETTFRGPARARDCVGGTEEAWVDQGAFESTAGAGEAPGAEEWVATPYAVVRYSAAKLRVGVRPKGTTVTMVAGVAFMWPPAPDARRDAGTADEGWYRLPTGDTTARPSGGVSEAVARCSTLAAQSRELTAALFSADGGAPTGSSVTDQVTTRRLARAACALAAVRVQSVASGANLDAASASWAPTLAAADAAWRSLPVAAPAP
jgi:hypothetical protein